MSGPLDTFDDFFPRTISKKQPRRLTKKQIRKLSKKQMRRALMQQGQVQQGRRQQEQGLGLAELIKSKEFKERVELLKRGSRLVSEKGKIAAIKLASRIKKARSRSIYD